MGCHFLLQGIPAPRDLPDPGIEPGSPALQADSLLSWVKHLINSVLGSYHHIEAFFWLVSVVQYVVENLMKPSEF